MMELLRSCWSIGEREHSYTVCPFRAIDQTDSSSGAKIRIGVWSGWESTDFSVMMFQNGYECWNGPVRSAKLRLQCGHPTKLVSVDEVEKCAYELVLVTSSACQHEELERLRSLYNSIDHSTSPSPSSELSDNSEL